MLTADLTSDNSLRGRLHAWLERRASPRYFCHHLVRDAKSAAAKVRVEVSLADCIAAGVAGIRIASTMAVYSTATYIPARGAGPPRAIRSPPPLMTNLGVPLIKYHDENSNRV
jgi:hypothetical protein